MERTNLSTEGSNKILEKLFCSAEVTEGIHDFLIFSLVLKIVLCITACLGNTLILVALYKESSLHPPSKLLYSNLAITDLCVGIVVGPLHLTYLFYVLDERWNICYYAFVCNFVTGYILCPVSLFTVTAISMDRLLALFLGLMYRQVVTLNRARLTVTVLWVLAICGTTMHFWNYFITVWYCYIAILRCLTTSISSYAKIFLKLRHHQTNVQDHVYQERQAQVIPLNIQRYKKALSGALWLQVTLVACYLPYGIVDALVTQRGRHLLTMTSSLYIAREFTVALVYLNSSLNPILYCWKIREVREAVKGTIRQLV